MRMRRSYRPYVFRSMESLPPFSGRAKSTRAEAEDLAMRLLLHYNSVRRVEIIVHFFG